MTQPRKAADAGIDEATRMRALMVQFPPVQPTLAVPRQLVAADLGSDRVAAPAGPVEMEAVEAKPYKYSPLPWVERCMPVQAVVDRRDFLPPKTVDIKIMTPGGKVIQILRYPEFGPYGRDPMDPAWFPPAFNARTALCSVLAPYAAVRCLAGAW
jgi:hypothetical protein